MALITVPLRVYDSDQEFSPRNANTSATLAYLLSCGVKRGDLVYFSSVPKYRNSGVLIYNGKYLENLDYEVDDYGVIPIDYQVITEFPLTHWLDILPHNGAFVRYSPESAFFSSLEYERTELLEHAWTVDFVTHSACKLRVSIYDETGDALDTQSVKRRLSDSIFSVIDCSSMMHELQEEYMTKAKVNWPDVELFLSM